MLTSINTSKEEAVLATNPTQLEATNAEAVIGLAADPVTVYLNGLAPSGRRSMRSLLQQMAGLIGFDGPLEQMPWGLLRYSHVVAIRAELLDQGKTLNTINTALAALRGVLKAAFLLGQFPGDEWERIRQVKRVTGKRAAAGRSLSKREINKLFRVCRKGTATMAARDAALLAVMIYGGLRRAEVVALKLADYQSKTGALRIRHGKGRRDRELVLPKTARDRLKAWQSARGRDEGALFCAIGKGGKIRHRALSAQAVYDIVRRLAEIAGMEHCSPHDLRRTFVTRLLEVGVDLNTARQLAGHEQIQTTTRYDRRGKRKQRKAAAMLDK